MTDIKNKRLEQLKKYAKWEKVNYPDDQNRLHVLDWAVEEIERLRAELNAKSVAIANPQGQVDALVMPYSHLEKIDCFPVGRAFATRENGQPVRFGWIKGYAHNPKGALVFRARWAHRVGESLIHPENVHHVCSFTEA